MDAVEPIRGMIAGRPIGLKVIKDLTETRNEVLQRLHDYEERKAKLEIVSYGNVMSSFVMNDSSYVCLYPSGYESEKDELEGTKKELSNVQKSVRECNAKRKKIDQELENVNHTLGQFRSNHRQNESEARLEEVVATLKSFYPGVRDRLANLCRPTQKRYNVAVTQAGGHQIVKRWFHWSDFMRV